MLRSLLSWIRLGSKCCRWTDCALNRRSLNGRRYSDQAASRVHAGAIAGGLIKVVSSRTSSIPFSGIPMALGSSHRMIAKLRPAPLGGIFGKLIGGANTDLPRGGAHITMSLDNYYK